VEVKMKKLFLIIIIFILFPFQVLPDEISAKSSIESVTIYSDRAEVLRVANLRVKPGFQTIIFEGLPASIIPNSVRVSGSSNIQIKFLGVEIEDQFLESPSLPEIKKIESQIRELELEISKMSEEIDILSSQENFIKSIQSKTAEKASQEIALAKPDLLSWEKAMGFFESKLKEIKNSKIELTRKIDDTRREIDALKKKLQSITPSEPLEAKKAIVSIEAEKEGDLKLNLSYTTRGLSWSPLYNLRALPEEGEIEFSLFSKVTQKSGEDWKNVKILLSTSSPSLETSPPSLNPWILDIYFPRPVPKASREEKLAMEEALVRKKELAMVPLKEEVPLEFVEAEISETGLHLNFEIPRKVTIPSDGSPHKFPIDFSKLPSKFDYITVPKLVESAFLRGKIKNTLSYPIISGNADIFISNEFVGSTNLPFTSKDEELSLFFGRDEQIKVKHELVKKERGKAGLLGGRERIKFAYRITIQNLRKNQIEIEVIDQIPISQNTQIEVKDVNFDLQPDKKDEKGILSWLLKIPPQGKKEINFEFTIEFPKDANIRGL
jgi:uncharacterized protein (TIGR02231 family)